MSRYIEFIKLKREKKMKKNKIKNSLIKCKRCGYWIGKKGLDELMECGVYSYTKIKDTEVENIFIKCPKCKYEFNTTFAPPLFVLRNKK